MPDPTQQSAAPQDDAWMQNPTGMEGIPQPIASVRPSQQTVELSPDDVEVQQPKPVELSADDVEVQGGLGANNGAQPQNPAKSDDSGRSVSAQPAQPDEDMTLGPPSWAKNSRPTPPGAADMRQINTVTGQPHLLSYDEEHDPDTIARGAAMLRDTPGAALGKDLTQGPVTLARGARDVYQGAEAADQNSINAPTTQDLLNSPYAQNQKQLRATMGLPPLPDDQMAALVRKQGAQQLEKGVGEVVGGGVQTYTLGKAGELLELGPMVAAGSREAQVALLKFVGSIELGAGLSQGMDVVAKHLGFSQNAREMSDTLAQFLPQLIGVATATKSFASENAPIPGAPEGTTAYGAQTMGNRAGGVVTEAPTGERTLHVKLGNATKNIKLPPNQVTTRPDVSMEPTPPALPGAVGPAAGPQAPPPEPPPPPDPAAVTGAQDQQAGISALHEEGALRQAAANVQNGKPPVPPPRQAPGMAEGVIKPEVIADLGRVAEIVGPEHQADIVHEIHQTLTAAIAKQPTIVLPDGKVEVVDSPKKAANIAAGVINDEIDRQAKEKENRLKQSETENAAQAQQNEQQKEAQQKLSQRAETILAANPEHPDPVGLLQRNLRVDQPTAQALLQGVQSPAEAQTGALVGNKARPAAEEPQGQVDAQLKALQAGTIPVVMLPEGSQYEPEIPPGMKKLAVSGDVPGAGTYIYDPRKIRPQTIKEAAKAGTHGDLLGHVQPAEEIPAMKEPVVLQAHHNGQPIQETVVDGADHGKLMAAHDQLQERHPGAEIVAKSAEQVDAERAAQPQPKEETNAVQKPETGSVLQQPHGQGEGGSQSGEGVQPGEQGHEAAQTGAAKEVDKAAIEKELEGYQSKTRVITFSEKLKPFLDADRAKAKPINDLHGEPTGWLAHNHNDGQTLIHPTEPYAIDFSARYAGSGSEAMRAMGEAQVYAIDNPAHDVFDHAEKSNGQTSEEPSSGKGDVFDQVEKQAGDRRNAARDSSVDRRQDTEKRKQVESMSPAELRTALLTSDATGLPNRRAFDEAEDTRKSPAIAMSDTDGLKAFNDKFGYEAGNALLKAKADALNAVGLQAYHDKGDEFLYRGETEAGLGKLLDAAREILRDTPITVTMDDGTVKTYKGADFSYGTGKDLGAAESGLKQHKSEREAAGERARGELRGIAESQPEKGKEAAGGSEPEHKYEYGSTQHTLDKTSRAALAVDYFRDQIPENELAGKGKDVDENHVTVRYGIQGNDLEGIRNFLAQQRPFLAKLGDLDVFPPSKHSEGAAVVVAKVESPQLHELNSAIEKHGDFAPSNFPDYRPHITVAYIKPEFADKYRGVQMRKDATFRVGSIDITDRDGNKETVQLGKPVSQSGATKEVTESPEQPGRETAPASIEAREQDQFDRRIAAWKSDVPKLTREERPIYKNMGAWDRELWKGVDLTDDKAVLAQISKRFGIEGGSSGDEHEAEIWYKGGDNPRVWLDESNIHGKKPTYQKHALAEVARTILKKIGGQEETAGAPAKTYEAEVQRYPGDPEIRKERVQAENRRHAEALLAEKFPGQTISSADRVETPAAKETSTNVGETPKKLAKGDAVTFSDAKGNEREGTVAYNGGIVIRIKGEDGKEYTVGKSKVRTSGTAGAPASLDTAGAGRAPGAAGELHPPPVGEVLAGVLPAASGERGAGHGGAPDGSAVHNRPESVSGAGTGTGSGQGSDTALDTAESAPVEPGKALAESPAEKPAAKAEKERVKPAPARNKDWFSHGADWKAPTNETARLDANIAALKLLREIEKEPRKLTDDEKEALANYVGWGALSKAFDPYTAPRDQWDRWKRANDELHKLLTEEEFAAARKSTLNAHYTSPELVRFMWDVMKRFGFQGGNVLEPAMGTGNFFGMMPKAMRGVVHAIGNELDPTTFKIAQQLYPSATLMNKDFKDVILPNNDIDLAISNVPFGGYQIVDPKYPKVSPLIHDYFFMKSLDKVKPGGVAAFITSTGTMDKPNDSMRQLLGSKADLLGAIRLPSNAFDKSSGTSVTTDMIFLRKRASGELSSDSINGTQWMKTKPMRLMDRRGSMQEVQVNTYFHDHPEMILGEPESHSMYGDKPAFSLQPYKDKAFGPLLEAAMKKLPRGVMLPADPTGSKDAMSGANYAPDTLKEGQFTTDDKGRIVQRVDGKLVPAEAVAGPDGKPVPAKVERVKALIGMRDELDKLLLDMTVQPDDEPGNSKIAAGREKLAARYQKFVRKYGELHTSANVNVFDEDPHYPRLLSLENHDKATKTTTLADIFTKRTVFPPQVLNALSPNLHDALNQILAERGYPDIGLMGVLKGIDPTEMAKQLVGEGLIFRDPVNGEYQTKERYLSGYVRDKLADAQKAVAQGLKEYESNVAALEKVQPTDKPISKIRVKLGATWIPLPAFKDFIKDTFHANGGVRYDAGRWSVDKLANNAEVTATYGTPRIWADELMELALNQKEPLIYDKSDGKSYLNTEATALARDAQAKIKKAFNDWASSSPQWSPILEKAFNYAYNNNVNVEFDGSHLTFPGSNPRIILRPHQRSAAWRILQDGRALLAHDVGAGKTWAMTAAIMEGRRIGIMKKPMLAIPNHLVEQWRNEFLDLYPGAKLLIPSAKDFEAKNRKRLMSKIATGDYDCVVLAHSQFDLMDISPERQLITLNAQMDELEETIRAMQANKEDKRTVKQMEASKLKLAARMEKLTNLKADNTINFDDLGVDYLFVDEAQAYKNLAFYTKMNRIGGLSQGDSKRAIRFKMKTDYLHDTYGGKGVILATGTPVSNTMAEIVTMMKYVAPDVLLKAGIRFFDDWAANFGLVVTKPQLSIDGRSYQMKERFSKFVNAQALMNMIRSFADVKTAKQLNLPAPKLQTGKPLPHYIPATPMVHAYIASLMARAEAVKKAGKPEKGADNMLAISTDGRKAATDMRLISPSYGDDPNSKLNAAVKTIFDIWKAGDADPDSPAKTQAVFLNLFRAIDKTTGETLLDLYDDMMGKLAVMGVPREQMARIHQFKTKEARQEAFRKMNEGELRILFGTTAKMGAGMNAQRRMAALHHMDNDHRPGDMTQRNGRIERQGNLNPEVGIHHWLTMQSFDTFQLQLLQGKATFIEQLWNGTFQGDEMEDVSGDAALTYEEMKVATSGNPDVKLQFDLQAERAQLSSLKWGYESQRRDSLQRAASLRMQVASGEAYVERAKDALARMEAVKGASGDGYKVELDGKTYEARDALGEAIKEMDVPAVNFHMNVNGIGVAVSTFTDSGVPRMNYQFDFESDNHDAPQRSMESLIRSVESRLSHEAKYVETQERHIADMTEKAAKLDESAREPFSRQAELEKVEQELKDVTKRMLGEKKEETSDIAEVDDSPDELEEGEDNEDADLDPRPKKGTELRASIFGLDYAAELLGKQAKAFWKSDVGPALEKAGKTAKEAGKYIAEIVYPRFNANEDALDSIMAAKGEMEKSRFVLEHINGGMAKFFDKMTLDQHLAFIDRYKLGVGQPTPELQKAEDLMRRIDDESLKLAQQFRPNLTAKENHFRVLWKVIPNSKTPGPQPQKGGAGNPTQFRRPYEGDKGFMKRATLDTISEGINYGGEPYTTNPWRLFTMAQASIKKYIAAQEHWANLKKLGLRKFVALHDPPPPGWQKIDDRLGDVYFKAESGEGSVHSGRWYLEPSAARILNNFLSRDLIRENPVGNALMLAKNLTTALSLSLSPFHFLFETLEAMGSQIGVGVPRFWNVALRKGDYGQGLLALREMGSFMAAPVLYARAGGSLIRATSDFQSFAQTKRGQAFLTQYPDAVHHLDLYFKGGGQFNMNPDYRVDLTKSFRQAISESNYVGAAVRLVPALGQAIMHPLFQVYIPRLKMGFFLAQNAMKQFDMDNELASGQTTELKIARQVVDATENRFGELNFSNLFWNNTFKSVMQFAFRSVTWKLGNWRGAGVAGAEGVDALRDPLRAMYEDAKAGKARPDARQEYIPRIGLNMGWLIGMGTVATIIGTLLSKALSGKMPWEWAGEDKKNDHSLPGAILLEMMHPRTGRRDPRTGLPERVSLPIGLKDFEHAIRDPKGYIKASESDLLSRTTDLAYNRDFFGNYIYDPNAPLYQQAADAVWYVVPKPMAYENFMQKGGPQDMTSRVLRASGVGGASKTLDQTKLEQELQQKAWDAHKPLTPEQVRSRDSGEHMAPTHHVSVGELRRHIREGRLTHLQKLVESMTYADVKRLYDRDATPSERRLLGPMIAKKRQSLLLHKGYAAVEAAQ